jgi:hypothetical protein
MTEETSQTFESGRFLETFPGCLGRMLRHPAKFFRTMPARGGWRHPTLFLLACALLAGLISWISGGSPGDPIGYPVLALAAALIAASILDYARREFFGVPGAGAESWRVVAYGSGLILFSPLPLLAWPAGLYGLAVIVIGMRTVHGLSTGRAFVATLLAFLCMNLIRFLFPALVARSPFGLFSG